MCVVKFANVHDTLLGHHAFASHLPQSLAHVASTFNDSSPWKHTFKGGSEDEKGVTPDKLDGDSLNLYNAKDAVLTARSWEMMQPNLERERRVYEHDRRLAAVCREMMRTGIHVDLERKAQLSDELAERRADLRSRMCNIIGDPDFKPGRLAEVRRVLFHDLGARYVAVTSKGLPSTNTATLEALRMSNNPTHAAFAEALLLWRLTGKIRSTYVDAIPLYPDGRARYNWKPFGTVSGRLSCRLQSAPRYDPTVVEGRVRELYDAAPGHTLIYYDVKQGEMFVAAYLSGDPVFIQATKGDVHWNNACTVFPKAAHLDKKTDGKKFRDIAKNLGFAISYCAEAEKVYITLRSKGFDVSYASVEHILAKLHTAYRVYYRWVEQNLSTVRQTGHMRSPFLGRIRWLGWYPKITDVANYPIQSGLADVVNERTIQLSERLPAECRLVAQIHDACIYECPDALVESAKAIISEIWSHPLDTLGGPLYLQIDLKTGNRWSEL